MTTSSVSSVIVIVKALEGGEIRERPPNFVTLKNIFEAQAVSKAKMALTNA
jgi:hypothetical protein